MKKITKREKEYVTMDVFEKAMAGIAKSFRAQQEILTAHTKALEALISEVRSIQDGQKQIQQTLSGLVRSYATEDRKLEDMLMRIERLEAKVLV